LQDKTGTITQGRMTATHVYSQGAMCSVTGKGYSVDGTVLRDGQDIMGLPAAAAGGVFTTFLLGGVLCNNTSLEDDPETGKPVVHGSATEAPLVVGAAKLQLERDSNVEAAYPRYDEVSGSNSGHRGSGECWLWCSCDCGASLIQRFLLCVHFRACVCFRFRSTASAS
jgi:magnesium-transporting ATPase (P-type)